MAYILSQLPVRNAQPLNTSVDRKRIGHMTVVEPESGCAYLSVKHINELACNQPLVHM